MTIPQNFPIFQKPMQMLTTSTDTKTLTQGIELILQPSTLQEKNWGRIPTTPTKKAWMTNEEETLLKIFSDPLNKMSILEIALLLGRSKKAVERKKEKMMLGSSRRNIHRPKAHLTYPEKNPGASLHLIPAFNLLEDKKQFKQPFLPFLTGKTQKTQETPKTLETPQNTNIDPKFVKANKPWSPWDIKCLNHYWNLSPLGIDDISVFLYRTIEETQTKARELNLPEKAVFTPTTKYTINTGWDISPTIVQKTLSSQEQHALAELTATRLNHLCTNPTGTSITEKAATTEINSLFEVQRHIFFKAIRSKAKKLSRFFSDKIGKEEELIQVGESALFEVITRWAPAQGINFCRATVAQNIERQMQQWLRNCRLVKLPSGLIQEIVEERHRLNNIEENDDDNVDFPQEKKTPQRKKSIARYLYSVHPDRAMVPLTETHEEGDDTRIEQISGGHENSPNKGCLIEPEHQSFCSPEIETEDIKDLLAQTCQDLPKNERYAFCQYHGIGEDGEAIPNKNLRELAQECNVSAERIRQRINLAKEKMAKKLGKAGIRCSHDAF